MAKKSKGGRPRRHRPSEEYIERVMRPWVLSALEEDFRTDAEPRTIGWMAPADDPTSVMTFRTGTASAPLKFPAGATPLVVGGRRITKEKALSLLRGSGDDLTIAEEAYKFLVERDGRRVKREERIEFIARWLDMDRDKLTNWLNRSKRAR